MAIPSIANETSSRPPLLAAWGLVILAVLAPWPYGCAHPLAQRALTMLLLALVIAQTIHHLFRRATLTLPRGLALLALALILLAALQTLPLPGAALSLAAPGAASFHAPTNEAARQVLGNGLFPLSLHPLATGHWCVGACAWMSLVALAAAALQTRVVALRAAIVITCGASAVAVYGVIARALFGNLLFGRYPVPTIQPFGPFVSKNHFAGYLEMAALLALGLAFGLADEARRGPSTWSWLESRRAPHILFISGAVAAMLLSILVSLSRGGVVSLAAGLVVFAMLRVFTGYVRALRARANGAADSATQAPISRSVNVAMRRLIVALLLVTLIGGGALAVLPREGRERLATLAGIDGDTSGLYRLHVWRDALPMIRDSPWLGYGFGAFADGFSRYKTAHGGVRVEHAESDWIEVVVEGGLVGLGLIACMLTWIGTALVRSLQATHDRLLRGVRMGAFAGLAALCVHSAMDFNLRIPSNALMAGLLIAITIPAPSPASHARRRTRFWNGVWLCAAVAAWTLGFILPHAQPGSQLPAVQRLVAQPDRPALRYQQADHALSAHLRRRPGDAPTWVFLGWLRLRQARPEGADLARYGLSLDPQNEGLRREVNRLTTPSAR